MNKFDINLLLALNFDGGPFMDNLMIGISGKLTWIPLYLFMLYMIYRQHGWRYLLFAIVFIAAGVGICDQIANIFKSPMTPYLRPSRTEELVPLLHIPASRGGLYGTVSAHAATSLCIFLLPAFMVHKKWFTWTTLIYPLATSYSRIYLGMHFPFQILFGLALGALVGVGLWYLFSYLSRRYNWSKPVTSKQ